MPHDREEPSPSPEGVAAERSAPASGEGEEAARIFYERLQQTGRLVDVDPGSDLADLPPHVTHVRYPDGTVERVGFSGF